MKAQGSSQRTSGILAPRDPRPNVDDITCEYKNLLGISRPPNFAKSRTQPELRNAETMHTNHSYAAHGPELPVAAPRVLDAHNGPVYAGTKHPWLLSAKTQTYPQTIATCDSTASKCRLSPASSLMYGNLSSTPLPGGLDAQGLAGILQELNQYPQRHNRDNTTSENLPAHPHPTQDIAGLQKPYQKRLGSSELSNPDSIVSNVAQHPSSAALETPNINSHGTHPPSARRKHPSAGTHQPALQTASFKPDVVYRQPQPFIGKLALPEAHRAPTYAAQLSTGRARKRTADRPDIRALPNHDQDPIE
ncbi:uncharacterized protein MAM_05465 [Metarhizium album ARSEF 1941]|uniref:Uncharacterized protein n=1 Tax=Metarhizium album (strain ARSEF 1941) TaxID=1081103 RepID=A0A0B2WSQ8_METAS|nr:uncharacterized protein MAM_05465 [Metarhizium album ARSEF 1941]KHN96522.1 hypothetical protein MAM_05465 [Metarhizium album ARSEF 1941]